MAISDRPYIVPSGGPIWYSVFVLMAILTGLCAAVAMAQPQSVHQTTFDGSPAVAVSNDRLELTVLVQGGSLASLVLAGDADKLNPLWDPARMARETGQAARTSGGTGHFVCVDGFGPTSAEERAAGLEGHGEAHRQTFGVVTSARQGSASVLTLRARLPIVQEVFSRTFRMLDGENVIYVDSRLENLLGFDRPVNWAEHATVGSPFLESGATVVDVAGSWSRTRPYEPARSGTMDRRLKSGEDFAWPMAPALAGGPVDLRVTPANPHYLDHSVTLVDPTQRLGWVTALHPGRRLVVGWIFRREEYPWVQFWGSYPPSGKMARGLEFGTQPFDVPRREAIGLGSLFGTPTYRWLPAKSAIESKFLVFYTQVPEGFRKVDEVRMENGAIVIEDRGAKLQVKITASLPL